MAPLAGPIRACPGNAKFLGRQCSSTSGRSEQIETNRSYRRLLRSANFFIPSFRVLRVFRGTFRVLRMNRANGRSSICNLGSKGNQNKSMGMTQYQGPPPKTPDQTIKTLAE